MRNTIYKVEDIHIMYKKVYFAAKSLVKDVKLLFNNGSYATAYNLAQVALEEFGKLNMLYALALRIHNKGKVTFNEIAVNLKNKNFDDDLGNGIVLLIEKNYIDYPPEIDSLLHQTNLEISMDIDKLEELITEDTLIVNLLEAYKELKANGILKNSNLSRNLSYHLEALKGNSLQASFYNEEFVMPFEVITKELCTARIMSVLILQRMYEINGYHDKEFDLFNFDYKYYQRIEDQVLKL